MKESERKRGKRKQRRKETRGDNKGDGQKERRKKRACMTAGLEPTTFYSTAHYLPPHGTIACTTHQLQILTLMT